MQNNGDKEEEKTQEKYTQFIPPYPNKFEPELHLNEFPKFENIEQKNPSESQISLRGKEAKRLNIIFDNNNYFSEDKNIKEILSNGLKNSNRYNDVYNIDLPNYFMPSSIRKNEEIKKVKNEENQNINIPNKYSEINDFDDYEIDINSSFKENSEIKKEEKEEKEEGEVDSKNNNDMNNNTNDNINVKEDNNFNIKEEEKEIVETNNDNEFENSLFYPEDFTIKKESSENYKEEIKKDTSENDIKTNNNNDDYEIEIDNENNNFRGPKINNKGLSKPKEKNKHKNKKIKNHHIKEEERESKPSIVNQITTLNINGLNSNEYYLGEIIEKGPNFPSTLGIIKYMDLILFSENYFGEKLEFNEISMKDDFQKILKIIPVGNKKYIFSINNSPKNDIFDEENDLIILHGKGGQETYYYIMKLTGEINGNSEYTIYRVKNNKIIIRHFKDSIGLNNDQNKESIEDNDLITEGINYDIVDNPDIEYLIMPGQQFLAKFRNLLKKEKEVEEKKKIIEEKNNYNLNFEFNFSILKEKYNKIMTEKQLEVEKKERNIKELKETINIFTIKENKNSDMIRQIDAEKNKMKRTEEQIKIKMSQVRKRLNESLRISKDLDEDNIKIEKDFDGNSKEFNFETEEEFNKAKENLNKFKEKIKVLKENIYCCDCKERKKEVIFSECSHLMVCKVCFSKYREKGNKMKGTCPFCKRYNKRLFFISYGNDL